MGKAKATQAATPRQEDWLQPACGPGVAAGGPGAGQGPAGERGGAPANLDLLQTTVRSPKNPWLHELSNRLVPLQKVRAAALFAAGGHWHEVRARSLGRTVAERVEDCGKRTLQLVNTVTGQVIDRPVRCLQRVCVSCCQYRAQHLKRRLKQALPAITKQEQASLRRPVMVTFAVRHCGDPALDRKRLQRATAGLRSSWQARQHKEARETGGPEAKAERPGYAYLRIPELAAGTNKDGHQHAHMLAWWPKHVDYKWLQSAWRKAVATADWNLGVVWPTEYKRKNAGSLRVDVVKSVSRVVHYIAKVVNYITKANQTLQQLDLETATNYLDEQYGKRWFATSRGLMRVVDTSFDVWELLTLPEPTANPPRYWWKWQPNQQAPP